MKSQPVILVVDDQSQNVELLDAYLVPQGYEIVQAASGEEALEKLSGNQIDLILLDVMMPGMDGFEVTRRVRRDNGKRQVPIVLVTSLRDVEDRVKGIEAGCDDFLSKPFDKIELLARVQSLLKVKAYNDLISNYQKELESEVTKKVEEKNKLVNELQESEEVLRASEEKYRSLVENINDILYTLDTQGNITYISPVVERLTKYKVSDLTGKPFTPIIHPDDLASLLRRFNRLVSGEIEPWEFRVLDKDGSILFVRSSSRPIYKDGQITGFTSLMIDVTERKKAEELLEREKLMLERTEDIAHIGSWEWDIATDTTTWSNELFRILQRDPREGAPSFAEHPAFYHPADMVRLQKAVEAAVADGTPYELEMRAFRKDGETRVCMARGAVEMETKGRPVRLFGSLQDITDRKQSEEKLLISYENLQKTLNDTINTMAKIVETRDPYTAGHQQKVADLAVAIAMEMKLENTQIDQIRMAAVIHDIGKMYVPSDILSKPGRLSEIEISLVKAHAQFGYDIVRGMDFPGNIAQAVLQHHERLDGSGYPNQLKGGDTLLEAKILAVADVIEAMASHRPYRPALGIEKALEEISKNKGRLYDPDVVDSCMGLFSSGKFEFKPV